METSFSFVCVVNLPPCVLEILGPCSIDIKFVKFISCLDELGTFNILRLNHTVNRIIHATDIAIGSWN
jgi:hypothetical protein